MTLNKSMIIGLTGGIATGKSTVTHLLKEKRFIVIDADKVSRDVVKVGKCAYKDILKEFGEDILNKDFTIDRKKLGKIIFNDKNSRIKLNNIVHPRITKEMLKQINHYSKDNKIIFLDIPLLIENRNVLEKDGIKFDNVWLVYTTKEIQIKRLMSRDDLNESEALSRIRSQICIDEKLNCADTIIYNTKTIDDLIREIDSLIENLRNEIGGK